MSNDDTFKLGGVNPCLSGDTLIQTVEGEIPIKYLVGTQPYVYCMGENGELAIKQASKVWLTKRNAKLVKIHHMRGDITCTPDHLIYTMNRGWVEAQNLLPGDSLKGLNRGKKSEKHCKVKLTGDKEYIAEHRFVASHFYNIEGMDVHHINNNGFDNRLSNLQPLPHNEHSAMTNTGRQIEVNRDELGRYIEKEEKKTRDSEILHEVINRRPWTVICVEHLEYTEDVYDMTVPDVHNFVANRIIVHNCAEQPLPEGGSCLLGSINLAEFVSNPYTCEAKLEVGEFIEAVKTSVIALNEVLDEGLELHPLEVQRESVRKYRQIGLGLMGMADMLIKLGITYGSKKSLDVCDMLGSVMINAAVEQSALLAREHGVFDEYKEEAILNSDFFKVNISDEIKELVKKYGMRNSQLLTIAPK